VISRREVCTVGVGDGRVRTSDLLDVVCSAASYKSEREIEDVLLSVTCSVCATCVMR
jgi:hypothetical protein